MLVDTITRFANCVTMQSNTQPDSSDVERWQAVLGRKSLPTFFVYAVGTTGIYCVPSCPSRRPSRKNVRFFDSSCEARESGYRPCLRCHPELTEVAAQDLLFTRACRSIEENPRIDLAGIASMFGYSSNYFQRTFSAYVGVSPKQYAQSIRRRRAEEHLARANSVTESIYALDYSAPSRFYDDLRGSGLSPADRLRGANHARLFWSVVDTKWGRAAFAATTKGVCAVELDDDDASLEQRLSARFKNAELVRCDGPLKAWAELIVPLVDDGQPPRHLSIDLRCTSFQAQVWALLARIPKGQTTTYKQLAESFGRPNASRAIAQAVAANPLAVIIPCHRVIREDGDLAGYRWGKHRKAELLDAEREC